MRKTEVVEIEAKSAFKVTIYLASIPLAIMTIVGLIMVIIGAASGQPETLGAAIPLIIMPVIMALIYGLIGMFWAFIYNKLSGKFGGLEIVITEGYEKYYGKETE